MARGVLKSRAYGEKRAFCLLGMSVSFNMKQGILGTERNSLVLIVIHEQEFLHLCHLSITFYVKMLYFALLQTIVATAAVAQIIIDVPDSLTQCDSTTLSWSGGDGGCSIIVNIYTKR
jgi:hypothetical protein